MKAYVENYANRHIVKMTVEECMLQSMRTTKLYELLYKPQSHRVCGVRLKVMSAIINIVGMSPKRLSFGSCPHYLVKSKDLSLSRCSTTN